MNIQPSYVKSHYRCVLGSALTKAETEIIRQQLYLTGRVKAQKLNEFVRTNRFYFSTSTGELLAYCRKTLSILDCGSLDRGFRISDFGFA